MAVRVNSPDDFHRFDKKITFMSSHRSHTDLRLSVFVFLLLCPLLTTGQTVCTAESRQVLEQSLAKLAETDQKNREIPQTTVTVGQWFLGTPYMEKTLELPGTEKLVINLSGLDCTTYLETVVTLVRLAHTGEFTFAAFEEELERIRYRNGINEGYSSRLHYFTDWMYQNQEKGIVKDITREVGGQAYENHPSFMSENPNFYTQLGDTANLNKIRLAESSIKERTYHYIPKDKISSIEKNIQSGDLIAITTSIPNLDVVHVGFAIEQNGRIHLLHASSKNAKVEISERPLSAYLQDNKTQSGIMVSRLTGN